jgi:hypothetical protein
MSLLNILYYYKIPIILIIFIILILSIMFLLGILLYYYYKFFNIKLNKIYLNDYLGESEKILLKYGDKPIKNMYIVKERLYNSYHVVFVKNILKYIFNKHYDIDNLYHISLVFDIKMGKNIVKKIKINKNLFLLISDNFEINGYKQIEKCIKIKEKTYTLNKVLNETKNKNNNDFYNWDINNNCQHFTKNLLSSMNLLNKKNIDFMDYEYTNSITKSIKKKEEIGLYILYLYINITLFLYKLYIYL